MADKESRTEEATDKKKADSRKKGQIARSADLVTWMALLIGATVMQSTVVNAARFVVSLTNDMSELIAKPDPALAIGFLSSSMGGAIKVVAPLAITFLVLGVLGHFAQVRFVLAWESVTPKLSKLNPISGFKRIFSKHSLVEAGKQLAKILVLGYIAYRTLWATFSSLSANGPYAISDIMAVTAVAVLAFVREVAVIGVVIGLVDYMYQRKKTNTDMKMSKDEVKQEGRQQDLAPEVKAQMRAKQRAMSRNRMMAEIKNADVVIVNPVHVAVALQYDAKKGAPRVVAKGAGFVAEKIREKADEHKIPTVQDIPLARTLHGACEIDEEIPMEMFEAVAQVLAFVFALRTRGRATGFHKMPGTPDLEEYEAQEAKKKEEPHEPQEAALAGV